MLKISNVLENVCTKADLFDSLCLAAFGVIDRKIYSGVAEQFTAFCSHFNPDSIVDIYVYATNEELLELAEYQSLFGFQQITQNQFNIYKNCTLYTYVNKGTFFEIYANKNTICVVIKGGNKIFATIK